MAYKYKNSKGKTYYLHSLDRLYYFSKSSIGAIDLPPGFQAVESKATGLPLLKRKN